MIAPRKLVSTLPRHINHDELLCAIVDELRRARDRRMTDEEHRWMSYLAEETGYTNVGQLIFRMDELEPGEILALARSRGRQTKPSGPGFLRWALRMDGGVVHGGRSPMAPNNVIFRLRMLLKRSKDAPGLDAGVDEVMQWLSATDLSHEDLDYLDNDARTFRWQLAKIQRGQRSRRRRH